MRVFPAELAKYKVPEPMDADDIRTFGFKHKPDLWVAGSVYEADYNEVMPPVHNGFQYEVISNGTAGANEPTWATTEGAEFADGSIHYKTKRYNAFLRPDVTLVGSTWSSTNSVPTSGVTFTATGKTDVKVGPVPAGVTKFELTNHVTDSDGHEADFTYVIKVKDR